MDSRLYYLLTLLPQLPPPGEPPPVTMAEVLGYLRQQGGRDLGLLADVLEAEAALGKALDQWILTPSAFRDTPAELPPALRDLFDDQRMTDLNEEVWLGSVSQAYLDLLAATGRAIGSELLPRWAAWEGALRRRLAWHRARLGGPQAGAGEESGAEPPADGFGHSAIAAEWGATRAPGAGSGGLVAAMEADVNLDRARLDFLDRESPRYSFTLDELVAYLLKLRLLERYRRLDREKGRALLKEVAAL